MDILLAVCIFVSGWVCAEFWVAYKLHRALKKVAKEHGLEIEDLQVVFSSPEQKKKVNHLFTETLKNSIILYNKDTGAFVCQAGSIEELAKDAKSFNNIELAIVQHQDKEYYFIDGKVKTDLQ